MTPSTTRAAAPVASITFLALALSISAVFATSPPGPSAEDIVRQLGNVSASGVPDEDDRLAAIVRAARAAAPDDQMWRLGWVLAETYAGNAKTVIDDAESLVSSLPDQPNAHYALGLCLVSTMNEVAIWNQGARAGRARELWHDALRLDPAHIGARESLVMYYRNAPAIAGGSRAKARELATGGLADAPEGAHIWHAALAADAADDKDWAAFDRHTTDALDAAPAGAKPRIVATCGRILLMTKEDPQAALDLAQPVADTSDNYQPAFVCAQALRALGRCEEAIPYYQRVLAQVPDAENSRIDLGLCLIDLGRPDEARTHLDQFLKDHPDSDRAKEAKKALKTLKAATGNR